MNDNTVMAFKPYYSFSHHTIFFSIGALLVRYKDYLPQLSGISFLCFFILMFVLSFIPYVNLIARIIYPILLIPFFLQIETANKEVCKKMRLMSILYYTMHFSFLYLYRSLFVESSLMTNSVIRFFVILSIITVFSLLILWFEKKQHFVFLKYLH